MFPRAKMQEPNHSCLPTPLAEFAHGVPGHANLSLSGANPHLPHCQSSRLHMWRRRQKPSSTQSSAANEWGAVSLQPGQPCPVLVLNS